MAKLSATDTIIRPRTLLVGVESPYNPTTNIESYFDEFIALVESNDIEYDHKLFIKLRQIDPANYFTQGKLQELVEFCQKETIEEVIISEALTGKQQRNISRILQAAVFDRTQLILEIFEKRAVSAEGKIQVEMAMLQHKKSRLAGQGSFLSQQGGGIGLRGPGRTQKEIDIDHIETLMLRLKRQLEKLHTTRETQRKKRLATNIPLICLIGYTNAGKSTIFNTLTKSDVLAEDQLFATLETTTRELHIIPGKKALLSDTVGFIQQLPHQLIEAFKATLNELQYAHLLVQVIDVSDPSWQAHMVTVAKVLEELEVTKPMLYVFNKADKLSEEALAKLPLGNHQPHVLVSATTPNGLAPLIEALQELV